MSSSFDSTLDLALKPSSRGLALLLVLHAVALLLVLLAMPEGWPQAVAATAVAGSWLWVRRHRVLGFGAGAVQRLLWSADGDWQLAAADGVLRPARLHAASVVRGPLLVLRFRLDGGGEWRRVIIGDEAPAEQLRALRARLSGIDAADGGTGS